MLRLTLKNLRANKVRFALTTFGVVLAVSFVVSAFVLGDGLRSTFSSLSDEISAGTDIEVRPIDEFGQPSVLTEADLAVVENTNGVDSAVAFTAAPDNSVRPIRANGEEIPTQGPPQLAFTWTDNTQLSPLVLVEGDSPGRDEFVMDLDAADRYDFVVGENYAVITPTGRQELTLSGITRFGTDNQTLGAVLMSMNADQVNELFGTTGFDTIAIAVATDADADAVIESLSAALPELDIVDQSTVARETSDDFNEGIDIVQNVLLGFAGVALFVSIFIIYNTFAIVLSQRTREMGLLRVVGADSRQLRRAAMGEAAIIGVIASALGIVGGLGVAAGLTAIFSAIGASLPDYPTIVSTRTIVVALLVGMGVTLLAAFGPTRKASRVAPIEAIRDGGDAGAPGSRTRIFSGLGLGLVGVLVGGLGLSGAGSTAATISLMALGAIGVFLGVTLLSPLLVEPVVALVAWPLRKLGVAGKLAGENARRNERRTATTAAALMIGLAVVSMALVVGESLKATISNTLESAVAADYIVTDQTSEAGFPPSLATEIAGNSIFDDVTGFRIDEIRIDGTIDDVTAGNFVAMDALFDIDLREGSYDTLDGTALLVSADRAEASGLTIGDTVAAEFVTGATADLTVTGIFHDESIVDNDWFVDIATFDDAEIVTSDIWLAFSAVEGADNTVVQGSLDQLATAYPQADIDTAVEFRERIEGIVDNLLTVLNALVALAVVIALIGIANTLALSVHERTREIGLVRAIGMTRRQTRRMIRYEAGIIALFGAVLGVVLGIGFGWATVVALPASVTNTVAIPAVQIIVLVVIAAVAGLLAALLPAFRAGRMNVLDAINV